MRIQHWILPAIGLMATLFGGRHASAQYDPTRVVPADAPYIANAPATPFPYDARVVGPHPGPFGPGQPMMGPVPGQPPMVAGPGQPMMAPVPPARFDFLPSEPIQTHHAVSVDPEGSAGIPTQFQPWPGISPYDHRFQEHYRKRGLWFQETNDGPDVHFFSAEAFFTRFREPDDQFIGEPGVIEDPIIFSTEEVFKNFEATAGLQLRMGVLKPDQSGLELEGLWTGHFEDVKNFNFAGFRGHHAYHVEGGGVELTRWTTPFLNRDYIKARSLYAGRYFFLEERFDFMVQDFFPPTPTFPDPFVMNLHSVTKTQLAGPEVGLQFELGGETLLLRSESKVGLMVNHERIDVYGNGFGIPHVPGFQDTSFDNHADHTHVSPTFEQSVSMDFAIIEYLPVLRRLHIFNNATLHGGYTFFVIGQVVRPTDTIVYRASPIDPGITTRRTHMYYNAWSIGIEWTR